LKPGEKWSLEVDLVRQEDSAVKLVSADGDAGFVRGRVLEGDRLLVELTAPTARGRFEARLVLRYNDPTLPELDLPISGVVEAE
jgi:SH3-like domain-containing protein